MVKETWKPISYDIAYAVSNFGRVMRLLTGPATHPGRTTWGHSFGEYLAVDLRPPGKKRKTCLVHVLVAEAFLGAKPEGCQVHHIDENKRNNHLENLEYLSVNTHYHRHALRNVKLTPMIRARIDYSKELGFSNRKTAKMIGVSGGCIDNYVNGKTFRKEKRYEPDL